MQRLWIAAALALCAGCGGGIDGDWTIRMVGTCDGLMTITGPDSALSGSWSCSNALGPVTGTRAGNSVTLSLGSAILQYPLQVTATLDGGSLSGVVSAHNYPQHVFQASR